MASIGATGSPTYSETLSGIDQMMTVLPDNTANQITARNVRDVAFTLYEEIMGLSSSVDSLTLGLSASLIYYDNGNQSTVSVGGLTAGSTFPNITLQTLIDRMLYTYTLPVLSISINTPVLEYGNTQSVLITWNLTKEKNAINTADIIGPNSSISLSSGLLPTNLFQTATGVVSLQPIVNIVNGFTFSVNDYNAGDGSGSITNIATASVSYSNRIYWGAISSTSSITLSSQILSLSGAGIGSGSELKSTFVSNYDGINAGGNFLAFSWPTSYGTPIFLVNSVVSTAFTKVNSNWLFTNSYGYTASYDVWISDTKQNSPISKFEIN